MNDTTEATVYDSPADYVESTEPVTETTESTTVPVDAVDYTPVIWDATSVICSVILAGALLVVGCLMGFKLWEVPHK